MDYITTTIANEDPIIDIDKEINILLADYGDTHLYAIHALYVSDYSPLYRDDEEDDSMAANLTITMGFHYEDPEELHSDLTPEVLDLKEFLIDRQKSLKGSELYLCDAQQSILGPNRIQVTLTYSSSKSL